MSDVDQPVLENRADTVAMHIYEASGGVAAWAQVPYLRFDFATMQGSTRKLHARHLWNRKTGDYRVEMPAGKDSTHVVLFNVHTREGKAYLNGVPLGSEQRETLLENAYQRFINDTYWLLTPLKLFDPGVHRAYVADSSDGQQEVMTLTFDNVGITPGDQYWIYADKASGRMVRWAFRLQRMAPDAAPRAFSWTDYQSFETPAGPIHLSSRKKAVSSDFAILTDNLALPADVPAALFTDPEAEIK